ncbi:restriction endonuclease subunit S [Geomonas nitrogeniifigens]|uniref:restriction endonuclease subunit S n=1 Tax=Geomonas diazotrophica TaxID=2843197 RepID=UPI001C2BA16F|nr:restriction endonuclease subunit S [Geomonas nitrogeniifigens]QXE85563.1 restriction endonuclease subunit S [Geomonas nitrogeniifigens]
MRERTTRIGDIAKVVAGGTPPRGVERYYRGAIPWVKTLDLNNGIVDETEETITEEGLRSIRGDVNPPGTVMVAMYGGAGTIGKSGVLRINAATNQAVASVLPNPDCFDSEFLHYQLMYLRSEWMQFSQGNRKDPNINKSVVEGMLIWLPKSVDEQKAIAARLKAQLAEVGKARLAAQAVKAESDALYRSIYRHAFHRLLPITVPPTFVEPPSEWSWVKLDEVARLESGHTPSRDRPDWWGGDVSWLSLTEIRRLDGKWVEETELRTNDAGVANSSARILPEGTVCFSRTASVGFVAIMRKPMATSQDFANWICTDRLNPEFLMHALIAARTHVRELATGATHKTIYMPTLKAFHICMPDRSTQNKLVRKINEQLAAQKVILNGALKTLSEMDYLPTRILAKAFEI